MNAEGIFKRYLCILAAAAVAGIFISVALVVVVDPYRLYQVADLAGLNRVKPQPARYQKQIKLHGARTTNANTLILGNSRAELGLDPDHPGFHAAGISAYNLALPGTGVSTAREQLLKLQGDGLRPVRIIVGVEFLDFLRDPAKRYGLRANDAPSIIDELSWQMDILFSMDSMVDSVKTVALQRAHNPKSITARGFNPLLEYNTFAREGGYYTLFQQRAQENAKRFIQLPRGLVADSTGRSPEFADLHTMIDSAAEANTDVHLVIYPYHAQILGMFEEVGLDKTFAQWKALMLREVESVKEARPSARITLWDFSGFSTFQCEPIPQKGDKKTQTQWYWEAGHFKPALGNEILSRLLVPRADGSEAPFGMILTKENLADNEARIARERAECVAKHPALLEDARVLIDEARSAAGREALRN